ncbi:uncharacterized protein LOC128709405 [Anopheles marshallii]|uniref:uncharacterized protein LOC128709405 n=1 Tax=Anopheles marshallii TaxID=1521116 RepID=UPI00237C4FF2|nr:uncharacterized protein LOC128709405 [Anopheles marshallii]
MEKIYTISKMVKFEHTWIVEPSGFERHCPCCEITTGTTKWLLNCCTDVSDIDGDGEVQCGKCYGPFIILLSERNKVAIISVSEEGTDRKVYLDSATYEMEPGKKMPLMIHNPYDRASSSSYRLLQAKRRKIVTEINFYENITMSYDVSYVL